MPESCYSLVGGPLAGDPKTPVAKFPVAGSLAAYELKDGEGLTYLFSGYEPRRDRQPLTRTVCQCGGVLLQREQGEMCIDPACPYR